MFRLRGGQKKVFVFGPHNIREGMIQNQTFKLE
jgi:hypothetical protein